MNGASPVRVLAISGSLRRASSNSALVATAARLAPATVEVSIYRELEDLPPFNPDRDGDNAPAEVATHAWASLAETLSVMSARLMFDASITVPLAGKALDADGIVPDAATAAALKSVIQVIASDANARVS